MVNGLSVLLLLFVCLAEIALSSLVAHLINTVCLFVPVSIDSYFIINFIDVISGSDAAPQFS